MKSIIISAAILSSVAANSRGFDHHESSPVVLHGNETAVNVGRALPTNNLVGFWHNFKNPSGNTYPLSQISNEWDVINVAFADHLGQGKLAFNLDVNAGTEVQFIADIKALKAKGKIVALSLGGQDGTVSLNDATELANFVTTLYDIITKFGFDGVDIDLEHGVYIGAPIINNLISAMKQLRQKVGPTFYLSMAPEHPNVQGGYASFGGIWGAYLPLVDGLREELTQLHPQYYNNGGFMYVDNKILNEGTVDGLVGGSLMLIEGFKTNYGNGWEFRGLRPDQVSFGVPSGPKSAGRGQATPEVIRRALTCLAQGVGCDTVKPKQPYPTFRGVMTWSINWDRFDNFAFSKPVRAALDSLGGAVPPPPPATSTVTPSAVPTTTRAQTAAPTPSTSSATSVAPTSAPTPSPSASAPTTAPSSVAPVTTASSKVCGKCTNCYYQPTDACFAGWNAQQCASVASFTWCGN
ncbi:hypothetical protein DYB37_012888 [Aphanomyces astaci]|uniref:chitinase n=2 Tax=Aphanomyces astaci TaxID=112090 RepID=A0A397C8L5_APHAT|nr:hypothetical protein DYB25_007133 [Aphanomyces astaci]RHY48469.1 hypothetical protein DYB34_009748 [Aphanomyces astaci]RHY66865.1 hypothetical protein DYB38_008011 [Aphanomyces astaci]RHY70783.1 hypothetical protein DYB30_007157 [Aphanomyces astaci]RHY87529.1 hypothetical protein DYB35_009920 [Aphanomyces astaci]